MGRERVAVLFCLALLACRPGTVRAGSRCDVTDSALECTPDLEMARCVEGRWTVVDGDGCWCCAEGRGEPGICCE